MKLTLKIKMLVTTTLVFSYVHFSMAIDLTLHLCFDSPLLPFPFVILLPLLNLETSSSSSKYELWYSIDNSFSFSMLLFNIIICKVYAIFSLFNIYLYKDWKKESVMCIYIYFIFYYNLFFFMPFVILARPCEQLFSL